MRTTTLRAGVLAALMLGLPLAAAQPPSGTAAHAAQGTPAFDPVWGQYTGLIGAHARAGTDGYEIRWSWSRPGQELVQEYINPTTKQVAHRELIKPGTTPGSLVLTSSALGNKQWHGTVQPDGRVLFIGPGMKAPYLAGRAQDGAWELTPVQLDGERIVAEKPPHPNARFTPVLATDRAGKAIAGAPSATANTPATRVAAAASGSSANAPVASVDTPEIALLRAFIDGMRSNRLPYERMAPQAVADIRPQEAALHAQWRGIGPIRSIEPGWPVQGYPYLVRSGDRYSEWRVHVAADGRIDGIFYRWLSDAQVAAVRELQQSRRAISTLDWNGEDAGRPVLEVAYSDGARARRVVAADGPAESRSNAPDPAAWGVLAELAGRSFYTETPRHGLILFDWRWDGEVLWVAEHDLNGLESSNRAIRLQKDGRTLRYDDGSALGQKGTVQPDGSIAWGSILGGFKSMTRSDSGLIEVAWRSGTYRQDAVMKPIEPARRQQLLAQMKERQAAKRRAESIARQESNARWSAAVQGTMSALQAGAAVMNDLNAHQNQLQNSYERGLAQGTAEYLARQSAQGSGPAAQTAAGSGSGAPVATTPPIGGRSAPAGGSQPSRPGTAGAMTGGSGASRDASSPPTNESACRMLPGKTVTQRSIPLSSREKAEAHVRGGANGACPAAYGKGTLGSITCTSESAPLVSVDSKGKTQKTGTRTLYTCSAPVTCPPVEHCESRPAGGSRQ